jgi:hypothetical protein
MIRQLLHRLVLKVIDPAGLEAIFAEDDMTYFRDTAILAAHRAGRRWPFSPWEVGRQKTVSAQITDTVAWLQVNGWQGDRGQLQCYALYLLEMRARYERPKVS